MTLSFCFNFQSSEILFPCYLKRVQSLLETQLDMTFTQMFELNVQFIFMQQMSVSSQFPAGQPGITRSLHHIPSEVRAPSITLSIPTSRPFLADAFFQAILLLVTATYVLLIGITSVCISTRSDEFSDHSEEKRENQIRCAICD